MKTAMAEPFVREDLGVRGYLHAPAGAARGGAVLTHGASSDSRAPLLARIAEELAGAGLYVLRCDLPYRQRRAGGPPRPHEAAGDREGLRQALEAVRAIAPRPILLGGHSYGGRQASMLAAEDPATADALLLLSYPLHPPGKPEQLRTAHLPNLRTPGVFVHGTRDPFGSLEEMRAALAAIPAHWELIAVERAGHDLKAANAAVVREHVMRLIS